MKNFNPILSRSPPTTALTFPQIHAHFSIQNVDEDTSIPPTPESDGSKGVRIIDHSLSIYSTIPGNHDHKVDRLPRISNITTSTGNNLSKSDFSETSTISTLLITPTINRSPVSHTVLLRNHSSIHLEHEVGEQNDNENERQVSGDYQDQASTPTLTSRLKTQVLQQQQLDQINRQKRIVTIEKEELSIQYQKLHSTRTTNIPQITNDISEIALTYREPITDFGKGQQIHLNFLQIPYINDKVDSSTLTYTSFSSSSSTSESSGYSEIIPRDERQSQIWMNEYWSMYDSRLQQEREERQKLRRFSSDSNDEGVRKWLISQQHHATTRNTQYKRKSSFSSDCRSQSNSIYTTLSPDLWVDKPKVSKAIVYSHTSKIQAKSFKRLLKIQLISILLVDEAEKHKQRDSRSNSVY
ncbi:uncharacterized protein L201_003206 [Kwoniella dendrophila CBS 6074]|uniref:Uncharacterized protein n=1 Tax=Kwoniella dendrophila CBS 6074 TaxID=1295534 RepID=A0AAX4JU02_9TREE